MDYISISNNQRISFSSIPVINYEDFMEMVVFSWMKEKHNHCVNYYGVPLNGQIRLICCVANDNEHTIYITSCNINPEKYIPSFSVHNLAFEKFEREIHEATLNYYLPTNEFLLKQIRQSKGKLKISFA